MAFLLLLGETLAWVISEGGDCQRMLMTRGVYQHLHSLKTTFCFQLNPLNCEVDYITNTFVELKLCEKGKTAKKKNTRPSLQKMHLCLLFNSTLILDV